MRLFKYINKIKYFSIYIILLIIYALLCISNDPSEYSYFQHPFLTIGVLSGYLVLLFQFDFNNTMAVMRFKSVNKCKLFYFKLLTTFSVVFLIMLIIAIIIIGIIFHDDITLTKIFLYFVFTFGSIQVLNAFYIVFSARFNTLFVKSFLFALICGSFAMNFFGEAFVRVNILFYNIKYQIDLYTLSWAVLSYVVSISIIFIVNSLKQRDII